MYRWAIKFYDRLLSLCCLVNHSILLGLNIVDWLWRLGLWRIEQRVLVCISETDSFLELLQPSSSIEWTRDDSSSALFHENLPRAQDQLFVFPLQFRVRTREYSFVQTLILQFCRVFNLDCLEPVRFFVDSSLDAVLHLQALLSVLTLLRDVVLLSFLS